MNTNLVYLNYWQRKEILKTADPKYSVLRWWRSVGLSEVEKVIFDRVKNKDSILDVGAGDLQIKSKFQVAGYTGEYHTQDIGEEFIYDYKSLDEINRKYLAILCLDVIEHLTIDDGLALLHQLSSLLAPGGVMIVQTPNGRCIRNPLISDMTHLHCYNLPDLWAYLTCMKMKVEGFRVVLGSENSGYIQKILAIVSKYVITRIIGLDYADNIIVIAHK
jgi:hypothetical protein